MKNNTELHVSQQNSEEAQSGGRQEEKGMKTLQGRRES